MVKERKERLEGPVGVNQGRSVGWREGERKAGNSGQGPLGKVSRRYWKMLKNQKGHFRGNTNTDSQTGIPNTWRALCISTYPHQYYYHLYYHHYYYWQVSSTQNSVSEQSSGGCSGDIECSTLATGLISVGGCGARMRRWPTGKLAQSFLVMQLQKHLSTSKTLLNKNMNYISMWRLNSLDSAHFPNVKDSVTILP